MSRVAVIGLGDMGSALARVLIAARRRPLLWNRSPERAAAFSGLDADIAGSAAEALSRAALVVVCLLDYRAVRAVLEPVSGYLDGRTVINLTNGKPEEAREMADWVAARGGRYVDGGIMAVPAMIGSQDAFILYSGSTAGFDRAAPVLEAFGKSRFLGRDPGLASVCDLGLLSAMYGLFGGFLHGVAMARSGGIAIEAFTEMSVAWLAAMVEVLPEIGAQIESGDYSAQSGSALAMQLVGIENIMAASKAQGIDASSLAHMHTLMARRVAEGRGGEDIAGLVESFSAPVRQAG
ncbi:NAD(P)-dependent oxidoreductase [Pelagibacterium limicola]|uniref:NAD(P)-dependent oxidoreductase n=1 Tax=Pelagibacterium limicola TaxID=2791022 RepID=UPI0018B01567|nr:NAD(P)-binding domain-containing protein [Pelagibacterium limicola]